MYGPLICSRYASRGLISLVNLAPRPFRCHHGYQGGFASYGATGKGSYGASLGKQNAIYFEPVRDMLLESIKTIPIRQNHVFNIGDYGTADGATSMTFMTDLLKTLRDHHGPGTEFRVIHEDQELNDFNSLFRRLAGIIPDPPSYLEYLPNVYAHASSVHFHTQCVPSNSMHFIMSVAAAQWLPKSPTVYKDSLYIYPDSSDAEKKALMKAGGEAWETFLTMRSKELIPGGLLFVAVCCEYTDASTGEPTYTSKSFLLLATRVWREFRDSGKILEEEFINTNFPIYLQTRKQLTSPFTDLTSPVKRSGLQLLFSEVYINIDVFYDAWMEKKEREGIDDRGEFARMYVAAHRNWSNSTFVNGLSETRSQEEKEKIVDELFATIEKRMTSISPDEFKNDMGLNYLIIRKRA
ncbi:uncharacterized protein [Haliotis asinina]|uniref:uncharacterized protein n=1 Tax=Haliotis asinina TaxID=109174 RepID=UPI003532506A